MNRRDGARALTRFSMGARPGDIAAAATDPRGYLERELTGPFAIADASGLLTSREALAEVRAYRDRRREAPSSQDERARGLMQPLLRTFGREVAWRTGHAIATAHGLRERLVRFWSNHFTVGQKNPSVTALAGAYEREAIRPHVLGRFEDLLLAAQSHPAMLLYLDNQASVGPNSRAGRRRDRGLNENLAREILELHTLGVDGGYTQSDVEELARALTGWSIGNRRFGAERMGEFVFFAAIHEPGARRVLGARYPEGGVEQGRAILRDLARHPATAQFLARKLARHFIADAPPADAVDRLARTFRDTGGDLGAVTAALIAEDAAWSSDQRKLKTPEELLISAARGLGPEQAARAGLAAGNLRASFEALGQRPFAAPSPAGWPDEEAAWIGPDAIMKRLEWAEAVGRRTSNARARDFVDDALGELASSATRRAVFGAESAAQGLTLALMSPEFQRR